MLGYVDLDLIDTLSVAGCIIVGAFAVVGAWCTWEWLCWGVSKTWSNIKSWMDRHEV